MNITDLGTDITWYIFEQLLDNYQRDLVTAKRVCKGWYGLIKLKFKPKSKSIYNILVQKKHLELNKIAAIGRDAVRLVFDKRNANNLDMVNWLLMKLEKEVAKYNIMPFWLDNILNYTYYKIYKMGLNSKLKQTIVTTLMNKKYKNAALEGAFSGQHIQVAKSLLSPYTTTTNSECVYQAFKRANKQLMKMVEINDKNRAKMVFGSYIAKKPQFVDGDILIMHKSVAIMGALRIGDFDTVKALVRTAIFPPETAKMFMLLAGRSGNIEAIEGMLQSIVGRDVYIPQILQGFALSSRLELIDEYWGKYPEAAKDKFMNWAVSKCTRIDVIEHLINKYSEWLPMNIKATDPLIRCALLKIE